MTMIKNAVIGAINSVVSLVLGCWILNILADMYNYGIKYVDWRGAVFDSDYWTMDTMLVIVIIASVSVVISLGIGTVKKARTLKKAQ